MQMCTYKWSKAFTDLKYWIFITQVSNSHVLPEQCQWRTQPRLFVCTHYVTLCWVLARSKIIWNRPIKTLHWQILPAYMCSLTFRLHIWKNEPLCISVVSCLTKTWLIGYHGNKIPNRFQTIWLVEKSAISKLTIKAKGLHPDCCYKGK